MDSHSERDTRTEVYGCVSHSQADTTRAQLFFDIPNSVHVTDVSRFWRPGSVFLGQSHLQPGCKLSPPFPGEMTISEPLGTTLYPLSIWGREPIAVYDLGSVSFRHSLLSPGCGLHSRDLAKDQFFFNSPSPSQSVNFHHPFQEQPCAHSPFGDVS